MVRLGIHWFDQFDYLGYILVALFLITWLISSLIWKFGRIEHKWSK